MYSEFLVGLFWPSIPVDLKHVGEHLQFAV